MHVARSSRMNRRELTDRETTVAEAVARGLTNREIARELGISVSTVKSILTTVMIKWDCANRTQVGVEFVRRGL